MTWLLFCILLLWILLFISSSIFSGVRISSLILISFVFTFCALGRSCVLFWSSENKLLLFVVVITWLIKSRGFISLIASLSTLLLLFKLCLRELIVKNEAKPLSRVNALFSFSLLLLLSPWEMLLWFICFGVLRLNVEVWWGLFFVGEFLLLTLLFTLPLLLLLLLLVSIDVDLMMLLNVLFLWSLCSLDKAQFIFWTRLFGFACSISVLEEYFIWRGRFPICERKLLLLLLLLLWLQLSVLISFDNWFKFVFIVWLTKNALGVFEPNSVTPPLATISLVENLLTISLLCGVSVFIGIFTILLSLPKGGRWSDSLLKSIILSIAALYFGSSQ